MMPVVAAAAFLALAACLLDLVLTLGVIRRLRQHTDLISQLSGQVPDSSGRLPYSFLAEGRSAGPFDTVATTGERLSRDRLSGHTLVGAFTPHCSACEERLPGFVDAAKSFPGGREQVIAVVLGSEGDVQPYRERLEPVARLVVEPPLGGAIGAALELDSFPAFGVLDQSGSVVGSGVQLIRSSATAGA
jgi:hypothetical protein